MTKTNKISIVLPAYNEERMIVNSVETVRNFLMRSSLKNWELLITDNGSTDSTLEKAKQLSEKYPEVRYMHLDDKGRGRALRKTWISSDADIVAYTDMDLQIDISYLPQLVQAIVNEEYDISIGSRFLKNSEVEWSLKRRILSVSYNLLLRTLLGVKFSDAQCGMKAVSRKVLKEIVPNVKDNEWFFDTELLAKAERRGFKIKEIPITCSRCKESKVDISDTVKKYLKSILRLRREFKSAE